MRVRIFGICSLLLVSQLNAGPKGYPSSGPSSSAPIIRNADLLTIEEVIEGATEPTAKIVTSIFSLYKNTHTWNPSPDVKVKLWEGIGKWPGRFPLALQVFYKGDCVRAERLDFPGSSKMIDVVAFQHHGMFVMNLSCEHRHDDYESKCAFSVVYLGMRIINGGPVISDDTFHQKRESGRVYEAEETKALKP